MIASHTLGMILSSQEANMMSKVTISLPENLLKVLDGFAANWNTSRSGAIAELISRIEKSNLENEMALGYMELADLNKNEAQSYFQAQAKAVLTKHNKKSPISYEWGTNCEEKKITGYENLLIRDLSTSK